MSYMSICEDEKVSQITKDFGSDSCFFHLELGSDSCLPSQPLQVHDDNPTHFSLQEIMEETPEAEAEIYGKILFYLRSMKSMEKFSTLKRWIVYKLNMDNYEAHLVQTSWSTPFGAPSGLPEFRGEYDFVEVMMREKDDERENKMRVIVDIDFRTQFELARPTPEYQELTNALPLIFVGSQEKLEKLISLICPAAKQSLRERGLHIPPWRKASYIHSKWLSSNCKRASFSDQLLFGHSITSNNGCFQDFVVAHKLGSFHV